MVTDSKLGMYELIDGNLNQELSGVLLRFGIAVVVVRIEKTVWVMPGRWVVPSNKVV